jgi:tRNA-binding protein
METIAFEDFQKVDVRVGRIVRVEEQPKARKPSYRVWVDLGPELGVRQSSAKLTRLYAREALLGRQVLALVNIPPRQVADVRSEVFILGAALDAQTVVLVHPEREVPDGTRLL